MPEERRDPDELDQEWEELLQEIRVAMPGVQVLFGFLLILPFTNGFADLTTNQKYVYFAALVCATLATVLMITPTAHHRLRWRRQDKNALLVLGTRAAIAATVFIALSMTASVYLIADFLFGAPVTAPVTALLGGLFVAFWYGYPLYRRLRS